MGYTDRILTLGHVDGVFTCIFFPFISIRNSMSECLWSHHNSTRPPYKKLVSATSCHQVSFNYYVSLPGTSSEELLPPLKAPGRRQTRVATQCARRPRTLKGLHGVKIKPDRGKALPPLQLVFPTPRPEKLFASSNSKCPTRRAQTFSRRETAASRTRPRVQR